MFLRKGDEWMVFGTIRNQGGSLTVVSRHWVPSAYGGTNVPPPSIRGCASTPQGAADIALRIYESLARSGWELDDGRLAEEAFKDSVNPMGGLTPITSKKLSKMAAEAVEVSHAARSAERAAEKAEAEERSAKADAEAALYRKVQGENDAARAALMREDEVKVRPTTPDKERSEEEIIKSRFRNLELD